MLDINGREIEAGMTGQLLCEVVSVDGDGVVLRILNSETELVVGCKHDEALGGVIADSEFAVLDIRHEKAAPGEVPTADGPGAAEHCAQTNGI